MVSPSMTDISESVIDMSTLICFFLIQYECIGMVFLQYECINMFSVGVNV